MQKQNDPTLQELADVLQETRRVFQWPQVDERGFFWFIDSYSWDGHEEIGLWTENKVVVFRNESLFNGFEGSCPVSMYEIKLVSEGGKVGTHRALRQFHKRIPELYYAAMQRLCAF